MVSMVGDGDPRFVLLPLLFEKVSVPLAEGGFAGFAVRYLVERATPIDGFLPLLFFLLLCCCFLFPPFLMLLLTLPIRSWD